MPTGSADSGRGSWDLGVAADGAGVEIGAKDDDDGDLSVLEPPPPPSV